MNARAAWRLERLGFPHVYRYAPGKADWLAAGLPSEGPRAGTLRAGTVAWRDVPTCLPDETIADAARRVRAANGELCIVVNEEGVVLGRLRRSVLELRDERPARDAMEEGPTTTRADDDLEALVARMQPRKIPSIIVTDPDGRLLGVLRLADAERALSQSDESS